MPYATSVNRVLEPSFYFMSLFSFYFFIIAFDRKPIHLITLTVLRKAVPFCTNNMIGSDQRCAPFMGFQSVPPEQNVHRYSLNHSRNRRVITR